MTSRQKRNRTDKYYKNAVLLFSGAQLFVTSLQLSQSISGSQFDAGKWGGLVGLIIIAFGLWYLHKKVQ